MSTKSGATMRAGRCRLFVLACAAVSFYGCAQPPRSMPDQSVLGFDGHAATLPDCAALARPSVLSDAGMHRPDMEWGCATYTNLAVQVAHPKDLVSPEKLGPADGGVAADGVRRYETGKVIPLDPTTTRDAH
jgi:pilus assembly protein CpaD